MVANDKIFLKIKNKIWLSIEKNIIKYGKIESRHKLIVIRDFCQATIRNIFFSINMKKLFFEISALG